MQRLSGLNLFLMVWMLFMPAGQALAKAEVVSYADLVATSRHEKTTAIIQRVIDLYHYKSVELDDAFAEQLLERYLDLLDPNRSFFLAADVQGFRERQNSLDDAVRQGDLDLAFAIFRIYRQRVEHWIGEAKLLIKSDFDFARDETYVTDRKAVPWALTEAELRDQWRKRIKHEILGQRLTGEDDAAILESLTNRYNNLLRRVQQFSADDVFESFINAFTTAIEPHTSYMSPQGSENFDISMRLSLEGIGAVLRSKDEFTLVQSVISGGPADISGQLHSGDRILGVGQGLDGPMEDVVGWRLEGVVDKIRGPKGSVVRLSVLPKEEGSTGQPKEIAMVRREIQLEEQAAKSEILEGLDGLEDTRIGVIDIPTFYRDFRGSSRGEDDFRSTTRDVRRLLQQLQRAGIDGIVIDLRGNGGGSLTESLELTGLFLDTGPVVQIQDARGEVDVERDPEPGAVYTGPLVVMVDRNSASASEIFAGAIQDYGRGIVVGEPTFGKGTVQTLVDLGRFSPRSNEDLGRLRLTMAQFFRISGSSTQHRGVIPDILFPTADFAGKQGERSLENALPWARIKAADYAPVGHWVVDELNQRHLERMAQDQGFQMLLANERLLDELEEETEVSLRESLRRATYERRKAERETINKAFFLANGLPELSDREQKDKDPQREEAETKLIERIQQQEAARILADALRMNESERLAKQVSP